MSDEMAEPMPDESSEPIPEAIPPDHAPDQPSADDRPLIMGMAITPDGKISLLFNRPIQVAGFDRNAALSIARKLKELAMQAPVAVTPSGLIVPPGVLVTPVNGNGRPPRHGPQLS